MAEDVRAAAEVRTSEAQEAVAPKAPSGGAEAQKPGEAASTPAEAPSSV